MPASATRQRPVYRGAPVARSRPAEGQPSALPSTACANSVPGAWDGRNVVAANDTKRHALSERLTVRGRLRHLTNHVLERSGQRPAKKRRTKNELRLACLVVTVGVFNEQTPN